MFELIRRWLGVGHTDSVAQDDFNQLNSIVPLKSVQEEAPALNKIREGASFACREAVLDRGEHVAGYQFALGRKLRSSLLERNALIRRVYDDAMLNNLAPLGVSSLLGNRFALIRVSVDSLKSPLLKSFPPSNTFIMISVENLTEVDLAEIRTDVNNLVESGVKLGWTIDRARPELAEFLNVAELIEIETNNFDGIQLKMILRTLHATNSGAKVIASGLQTSDDFSLCYQGGFDYFMGEFVSRRENWYPPKSEISRPRVFDVLNAIRSGAEYDVIADKLRLDPILTFKLLRYINSPGIGLLQKVDDISQVLMLLGRDRFYRWISLLLYDFKQVGYQGRVLIEHSLTRARFMESLAGRGYIPNSADQLFLIGLFSLLGAMMNQPLIAVLKQVSVPEAVASALYGNPGEMGDALSLAIAIESSVPDDISTAAARCGLDEQTVAALMIQALAWTQQIVSSSEER